MNEKESTNENAKEVAKSMAENMASNMKDPNFLEDKERMEDEVRKKIIAKRKEREGKKLD